MSERDPGFGEYRYNRTIPGQTKLGIFRRFEFQDSDVFYKIWISKNNRPSGKKIFSVDWGLNFIKSIEFQSNVDFEGRIRRKWASDYSSKVLLEIYQTRKILFNLLGHAVRLILGLNLK